MGSIIVKVLSATLMAAMLPGMQRVTMLLKILDENVGGGMDDYCCSLIEYKQTESIGNLYL